MSAIIVVSLTTSFVKNRYNKDKNWISTKKLLISNVTRDSLSCTDIAKLCESYCDITKSAFMHC